jgi:putative transcriptional regulator
MGFFMELKNNIRKLRFENGEMTQKELAAKLDVSRQTIIAIEKGKFNPSMKLGLQIAKLFKVKCEDVFYLSK